jgi:hypothetical protein
VVPEVIHITDDEEEEPIEVEASSNLGQAIFWWATNASTNE